MDFRLTESVTVAELEAAGVHTTIGFTSADGMRTLVRCQRTMACAILREAISRAATAGENGSIECSIQRLPNHYDITFVIRTGHHNTGRNTLIMLAPRPVVRRDRRAEAAAVRQQVKAKNAEKAWGEGKPMKGKMRVLGGKK